MSFKNYSFNHTLCAALDNAGYGSVTDLNKVIIPHFLNADDLYITAPVGAGKTTTILICALNQAMLSRENTGSHNNAPSMIVLAPTREQVNHVIRTVKEICRFLPNAPSISMCQNPYHFPEEPLDIHIDILVSTPENLVDSIKEKTVSTHQVKSVIFKSADQMIDAGYWNEMDRIHQLMPSGYQSIILASNNLEGDLLEISRVFQKSPFQYSQQSDIKESSPVGERVHIADNYEHKKVLLDFLIRDGEVSRALIITSTSACAKNLSVYLQSTHLPNTLVLNGCNTEVDAEVEDSERKYLPKIFIGTDDNIRKLKNKRASHIINFHFPRCPEAYFARQAYLSKKTRNPMIISLVEKSENKRLGFIENIINKPLLQGLIPGLEPKSAQKQNKKGRYGRQQKGGSQTQKHAHKNEYSGFMRSNTRRTQSTEESNDQNQNIKSPQVEIKPQVKNNKQQKPKKRSYGNTAERISYNRYDNEESQPLYNADHQKKLYQQEGLSDEQHKTQPIIKVQRKIKVSDKVIKQEKEASTISRIAGKLGLSTKNK